jgi:hypothetical protein
LAASALGLADQAVFRGIQVPDAKGRSTKAVLTLNDKDQVLEIKPVKGTGLNIPYAQIDKFAYEFTKKHRVSESTVATAPIGIGAVMMFTKSRSHWLEIGYHDQNSPHAYILRMDKHNYLKILDALKAHTGKDPEILGNADKR